MTYKITLRDSNDNHVETWYIYAKSFRGAEQTKAYKKAQSMLNAMVDGGGLKLELFNETL